MNNIEHYVLPEHKNNIYKKEAISSMALVRDIANKINELIDSYNELNKWQFEKHQEQDGEIRKGILYIKDNLINTLHDLIKLLEHDGFFDKTVSKYTVELEKRIDNLLGSIESGSTSLDAELIDLRLGANGIKYSSAGKSVRTNLQNILTDIEQKNLQMKDIILTNTLDDIVLKTEEAVFLNAHGVITSLSSGNKNFIVTQYIDVLPGEIYLVSGCNMINNMIYAFYNEDKILVSGKVALKTYDIVDNEVVIVPPDARYLIVGTNKTNIELSVRKVTSYSIKNDVISNYLDNISSFLLLSGYKYEEPIQFEYATNTVIEPDGSLNLSDLLTDNYLVSEKIPVQAGEVYHINASSHFGKATYCIYDITDKPLQISITEDDRTHKIIDEDIIIPLNASYIRICCSDPTKKYEIKKAISSSESGSQWQGITWVAYGDSLTEANYRARTQYHDYIKNETGINVLNYGISGSGYARSENAWHSRITELAEVDFDVITFFGSGNDLNKSEVDKELGTASDSGTDTIAGCINTTLEKLYSIKPFAKVGIITPTPWVNQTPKVSGCYMEQYSELLIAIAKRWGIPVLDLYHSSTLQPDSETFRTEFYNEDGVQDNGVHPNSKGHKRIYPQIREFLKSII